MSYIRSTEEGEWEDTDKGLYVYSSLDIIHGLPRRHKPFVEVVMRMLDQSGELTEEELERAHSALRKRLRIEEREEDGIARIFTEPQSLMQPDESVDGEEDFDEFLKTFEGGFVENPENYD